MLYRAILHLADDDKHIDTVAVHYELERRGWIDDFGDPGRAGAVVDDLRTGFVIAAYLDQYIEKVKGAAIRRRIVAKMRDAEALALDARAPMEDVAEAAGQIAEALSCDGPATPRVVAWRLKPITSADLEHETEAPTWLVKRVMVKGEPAVIGAPQKAGKTSFAIDLALSLASGEPFLNYFPVYKPVKVMVISGESGRWTIRNQARQVCASRGIALETANVLWQFDLPQLSNPAHLARLTEGLRRDGVEVVIIDPLYLSLLEGNKDAQASNVFDMGPVLRRVRDACLAGGATPVLVHHCSKPKAKTHDPVELPDLSMAGVAEFAAQWLLLNRREPFTPGEPGKLWLTVGGRCGQSGVWEVDVDEGTLNDDFTGRRWDVTVTPRGNTLEQRRAEKAASQKQAKLNDQQHEESEFLRALDTEDPEGTGATLKPVRIAAGMSLEKGQLVQARLIKKQIIEAVDVRVPIGNGAKRRQPGFRRKPEHGEHGSGTWVR